MLGDWTIGSFSPGALRDLLRKKENPVPNVVKTSQGVTIQKPFWMSKKVVLTGIAFGIALYQAYTGKWDGLTPEQLAAQIAKVVAIIGPIVMAVQAIARVDAQSQGAALIADGLKTLSELSKPGDSGSGSGTPPAGG